MRITPATPKAIRHACLKFHYAKAVPSVQYGYNIYNDDDEWCGCICYSSGANNHIASPFGLNQGEVIELVRVALNGKQGHGNTSKAVSMTLRQVHKDAPLVRCIISYADMDESHIGTIYQATNWIYLGRVKGQERFFINGVRKHKRSVNYVESMRDVKEGGVGVEMIMSLGKRKYAYPMDRRARKLLQGMAKPYEKADKCR